MLLLLQETVTENAAAAASKPNPVIDAGEHILRGDFSTDNFWALWTGFGWPALLTIILIVVVLVASTWVRRIILGASGRAHLDQTLARFFANMARWGVLVLGALAVLNTFGIETTSFAAAIAAVGFAIGMALSGTLGNFAAGMMLLVFRPFKVGDVVTVAGITAVVDEIDIFTTQLDTFDNRRFIVPNGKIFGETIENISHHPTRRIDVAVGTDYSSDLDAVRDILTRVATGVEGRLPDKDIVVSLLELGESSINWAVRVWVKSSDFGRVKERLPRDIKVALDEAGVGIPFPQRDLHVYMRSGNLNGG
jgi:small conductance mechanosensitive channel